jgi:hypothetical protein
MAHPSVRRRMGTNAPGVVDAVRSLPEKTRMVDGQPRHLVATSRAAPARNAPASATGSARDGGARAAHGALYPAATSLVAAKLLPAATAIPAWGTAAGSAAGASFEARAAAAGAYGNMFAFCAERLGGGGERIHGVRVHTLRRGTTLRCRRALLSNVPARDVGQNPLKDLVTHLD